MNKRGAYFFVIDALIAASIIFLSLIIIFTTHSAVPETKPSLLMMGEFTDFLTSTKIREFPGDYVRNLTLDGNITNLDNTLLEQLTEFYYLNDSNIKNTSSIMSNFTKEISKGMVANQRSFLFYINKTLIYNRSITPMDKSSLVLSSQKISFKRINETYIYGPVLIEVKMWV